MQPLRAAMAAIGLGIAEGAQTWVRCSGSGSTIQLAADGWYEIDCDAHLNRRDGDDPLMLRYVAHAAEHGVVFDPELLELRCARVPDADVEAVMEELRASYEGRGICIAQTGGGWTFRTRPECSRLAADFKEGQLSPAALETLATIALWGPLTFAEIERIRERDARAVVVTLADRRLIRAGPRREGRVTAMTWMVDTRFYEMFDLPGPAALPTWQEARRPEVADLAVRTDDEPPGEDVHAEPGASDPAAVPVEDPV